jgi:hypothetical protein
VPRQLVGPVIFTLKFSTKLKLTTQTAFFRGLKRFVGLFAHWQLRHVVLLLAAVQKSIRIRTCMMNWRDGIKVAWLLTIAAFRLFSIYVRWAKQHFP